VILRDVTAQKETEQMQRDLVSIVSHELRAPLTAIKGFAKTLVLKRDTMDGGQRDLYLATVNEQADRLARLVEDLLQVSRIDARRLKLEPAAVDLGRTVDPLPQQFASKWAGRPIRVRVPPGTLAWADPRKLEEILINLIDNAIKYSPAGTPVWVSARKADGEVEVSIEDRGIGISPEHVASLFQKFHRVSTPETRDIGGTGLGLYIVKGLVEAQGGRVWVESVPGSGSTFSFTLPVPGATGRRGEAIA
jgi:two-component system phosphate regulon sensor histidine kinase PhoR